MGPLSARQCKVSLNSSMQYGVTIGPLVKRLLKARMQYGATIGPPAKRHKHVIREHYRSASEASYNRFAGGPIVAPYCMLTGMDACRDGVDVMIKI